MINRMTTTVVIRTMLTILLSVDVRPTALVSLWHCVSVQFSDCVQRDAWEVMHSPPSIRPSVRLLPFYLRNRLTDDLEILRVTRS